MLDVLFGMAFAGVKNLLSSEIGKRAIHVAAHKAGEAAMDIFEHRHQQSSSRNSGKSTSLPSHRGV